MKHKHVHIAPLKQIFISNEIRIVFASFADLEIRIESAKNLQNEKVESIITLLTNPSCYCQKFFYCNILCIFRCMESSTRAMP